jgi:glutathione synthase
MKTVAIYANNISGLNPQTDGTLRLAHYAHKNGAKVYFVDVYGVGLNGNKPQLWGTEVIFEDLDNFNVHPEGHIDPDNLDFILIRKDPPVDDAYTAALQILSLGKTKARIVNNPGALLNYNEKLLAHYFPQAMVPTLITNNGGRAREFAQEWGTLVIKPLNGFGGQGVVKVDSGDELVFKKIFKGGNQSYFVCQKYIPGIIDEGEKRVYIIDGKVICTFLKIPAPGDFRANTYHGSSILATRLTPEEENLMARVGDFLKTLDIYFAGVDMIGGNITEINVTSVGGFVPALNATGIDLAAVFWDGLTAF